MNQILTDEHNEMLDEAIRLSRSSRPEKYTEIMNQIASEYDSNCDCRVCSRSTELRLEEF